MWWVVFAVPSNQLSTEAMDVVNTQVKHDVLRDTITI